jgi:hypothetical protein
VYVNDESAGKRLLALQQYGNGVIVVNRGWRSGPDTFSFRRRGWTLESVVVVPPKIRVLVDFESKPGLSKRAATGA